MKVGGFMAIMLIGVVMMMGVYYMSINDILFTEAVLTELTLSMTQIYLLLSAIMVIVMVIFAMARVFTR